MKKWGLVILIGILFYNFSFASPYGAQVCQQDPRLKCINTSKSSDWRVIKANRELLDLVTRINRVNIGLSGTVAVPINLENANMMSTSPFPLRMPAPNQKILIVDLQHLAWGAYDPGGKLLRWGPIAPGRDRCEDEPRKSCKTKVGNFAIYVKKGAGCKSGQYPKPNGGAKMPYCSFFNQGQAIHAGKLPGRPDSHGCVRSIFEDAKWLSDEFLEIGTRVQVRAESEL